MGTAEANGLPKEKLAFTLEEWREATGESRSATYAAMRSGALKAKKRGRRTIILHSDGAAYLASLPDYSAAEAA